MEDGTYFAILRKIKLISNRANPLEDLERTVKTLAQFDEMSPPVDIYHMMSSYAVGLGVNFHAKHARSCLCFSTNDPLPR